VPIDGDDRLRVSLPRLLLAAACVLAVSLVPLYAHRLVTMLDLFNHLARGFVLANYHRNPFFQTYWQPNWRVMPSLTIDGFVLALNGTLSLLAIGKLFVVLVFIVLLSGLINLHQAAHRKWSLVPLLGMLFLYNRMMLSGLVNYMLGIGLCLHGLAIWLRLRERPATLRLGVFAAIVTLTYLVHLMAAAVLGLMVAGVEIAGLLRRRAGLADWVRDLAGPVLAYIPVFAIMIFLAPHSTRNGVIIFHDLASKIGAFAVVITYDLRAEAIGLAVIAAALAGFALRGAVRISPALLGALLLLALVQMAMPYQILTGTAADHRVPIALWLLGCCMIDVVIAGGLAVSRRRSARRAVAPRHHRTAMGARCADLCRGRGRPRRPAQRCQSCLGQPARCVRFGLRSGGACLHPARLGDRAARRLHADLMDHPQSAPADHAPDAPPARRCDRTGDAVGAVRRYRRRYYGPWRARRGGPRRPAGL
jgi:hypothetical protein